MAKVLIVDDNRDNRELLTFLLARRGHVVVEAGDGATGVSRALAEKPDLILMDLAMPVMNGQTAARLIRVNEELAGIPLLGMSAVHSRLDYRGDDSELFDAFFELPVPPAALLERIEAHLPPAGEPA